MADKVQILKLNREGELAAEVTVLRQYSWDDEPFYFGSVSVDGSLDRMMASLAAIRETIPEAYRSVARCEIEGAGDYNACVLVQYRRPATPEEILAYRGVEKVAKQRAEEREREEYKRLRAKFEGK